MVAVCRGDAGVCWNDVVICLSDTGRALPKWAPGNLISLSAGVAVPSAGGDTPCENLMSPRGVLWVVRVRPVWIPVPFMSLCGAVMLRRGGADRECEKLIRRSGGVVRTPARRDVASVAVDRRLERCERASVGLMPVCDALILRPVELMRPPDSSC